MSETTLMGDLKRRVSRYDTEEERQQAKVRSYEKYKSKKYYCVECDKTMSLYNYRDHITTKLHLKNKTKDLQQLSNVSDRQA